MDKEDKKRIARLNIRGLKWIKNKSEYNLVSLEVYCKLNDFIDELIEEQKSRLK